MDIVLKKSYAKSAYIIRRYIRKYGISYADLVDDYSVLRPFMSNLEDPSIELPEKFVSFMDLRADECRLYGEKIISFFDDNLLNKIKQYFKVSNETFYLYIIPGNNDSVGRGTIYGTNIYLFPRNDLDRKHLIREFRVMIHEIIHFYSKFLGLDKQADENFVRLFAPKGILFMEQNSKEYNEKVKEIEKIMLYKND